MAPLKERTVDEKELLIELMAEEFNKPTTRSELVPPKIDWESVTEKFNRSNNCNKRTTDISKIKSSHSIWSQASRNELGGLWKTLKGSFLDKFNEVGYGGAIKDPLLEKTGLVLQKFPATMTSRRKKAPAVKHPSFLRRSKRNLHSAKTTIQNDEDDIIDIEDYDVRGDARTEFLAQCKVRRPISKGKMMRLSSRATEIPESVVELQQPVPKTVAVSTANIKSKAAAAISAEAATAESLSDSNSTWGTTDSGTKMIRAQFPWVRRAEPYSPTYSARVTKTTGKPEGGATPTAKPQGGAILTRKPQGGAILTTKPQGRTISTTTPQGRAILTTTPQGRAILTTNPQGRAILTTKLQGNATATEMATGMQESGLSGSTGTEPDTMAATNPGLVRTNFIKIPRLDAAQATLISPIAPGPSLPKRQTLQCISPLQSSTPKQCCSMMDPGEFHWKNELIAQQRLMQVQAQSTMNRNLNDTKLHAEYVAIRKAEELHNEQLRQTQELHLIRIRNEEKFAEQLTALHEARMVTEQKIAEKNEKLHEAKLREIELSSLLSIEVQNMEKETARLKYEEALMKNKTTQLKLKQVELELQHLEQSVAPAV